MLREVIDAMRAHPAHPGVQRVDCSKLASIFKHCAAPVRLALAQAAMEADVLPAIVATIGAHQQDACWALAHIDVLENACWALAHITAGADAAGLALKQAAADAGALPAIVAAMAVMACTGTHSAILQEYACAALAHITSDTDAAGLARAQAAADAGALPAIVAAMFARKLGVLENACWALAHITASADAAGLARRQAAAVAGALPAIVAVMRARTHDPRLQEYACVARANITSATDTAGLARA
jgi:hypothetical protein